MSRLPASRLLKLLPALYRIDPDAGNDPYIGHFLLAFEKLLLGFPDDQALASAGLPAGLRGIEEIVNGIAQTFDAQGTPTEFLPWLASWVALSLRADLSQTQQREFLANTVQRYRTRGTPGSLLELLKIFTQGAPGVIEEDRLPHHFTVNFGLLTQTQFGGKIGEYPAYIERQTGLARGVIELEKPAHTYFQLSPIFPTLRISPKPAIPNAPTPYYYSTVGVDTFLGAAMIDPGPPTVSITAAKNAIALGDTLTLAWSSTNATVCTASGDWSGTQATKGSLSLTPAAIGTYRYSLEASLGAGVTASATAVVTVYPPGTSIPATATAASSAGASTPASGAAASTASTSTPSAGTSTQASGTATSPAGTATSAAGSSTPATGTAASTASTSTPSAGTSTQTPGTATSPTGTATSAAGSSTPATGTAASSASTSTSSAGTSTPASGTATSPTGTATTAAGSSTAASGTATSPASTSTSSAGTSTQAASTSTPAPASSTQTSASPLPTVTITATPATLTLGQPTTLNWSSTNATSGTASGGWSGAQATSGSLSLTPAAVGNASYTLTCSGPGGSASATAMVAVNAPAPTVSLSASSNPTFVGIATTLTWSSTNATSGTASGAWAGNRASSGSLTITPTATGTFKYILTVTGPGGSASASLLLTVNAGATGNPGTPATDF